MAPKIRRFTLYRAFNADDDLLYVGATMNPVSRALSGAERPWWDEVARVELERFGSLEELREAEIAAIRDEQPRYNGKGAKGKRPYSLVGFASYENIGVKPYYLSTEEVEAFEEFVKMRNRTFRFASTTTDRAAPGNPQAGAALSG